MMLRLSKDWLCDCLDKLKKYNNMSVTNKLYELEG